MTAMYRNYYKAENICSEGPKTLESWALMSWNLLECLLSGINRSTQMFSTGIHLNSGQSEEMGRARSQSLVHRFFIVFIWKWKEQSSNIIISTIWTIHVPPLLKKTNPEYHVEKSLLSTTTHWAHSSTQTAVIPSNPINYLLG